jgi:hypothetical protein
MPECEEETCEQDCGCDCEESFFFRFKSNYILNISKWLHVKMLLLLLKAMMTKMNV